MDKELKRLVTEILSMILLLIIVIPICVHASNNYQMKKRDLLQIANASVDISSKGEVKEVTIITNSNHEIKTSLILKISEFSDEYLVYLDDQVYELKQLEYTSDGEYRYYNLGFYEVADHRVFSFRLKPKDKVYYDESITYSFMTEGLM